MQSQTRSIFAWGVAPLACLLGLLSAVPAAAEMPPEQRIELLEQRLQALQQRVERLESEIAQGVPVNQARRVQPLPGGWREAANWKLLAAGMQEHEVVEILGQPDKQRTVSKFEFWSYADGEAKFYLRRLKSWTMPRSIDAQ